MKRLRTICALLLVGVGATFLTGCEDNRPDPTAQRQAIEARMQIMKGPDGHDYVVYREEHNPGFNSATLAVGMTHSQECSHPRCKSEK